MIMRMILIMGTTALGDSGQSSALLAPNLEVSWIPNAGGHHGRGLELSTLAP